MSQGADYNTNPGGTLGPECAGGGPGGRIKASKFIIVSISIEIVFWSSLYWNVNSADILFSLS